jgi:hypothetical protein
MNPIAKLTIVLWLLYFVGVGFPILGRAGFLLVIAFAGLASAQTSLSQATLSAAQSIGPSGIGSGGSGTRPLASATHVTVASMGSR